MAKLRQKSITHEQITPETVFVKIDCSKKVYEASLASFSRATVDEPGLFGGQNLTDEMAVGKLITHILGYPAIKRKKFSTLEKIEVSSFFEDLVARLCGSQLTASEALEKLSRTVPQLHLQIHPFAEFKGRFLKTCQRSIETVTLIS